MPLELALTFPDAESVHINLGENGIAPQSFTLPLDPKTREDLTWYLETYPVHYTTEIDDARAAGIADKLKGWGGALFESVFQTKPATRLFEQFRKAKSDRLLTISSLHPAVLAQPWELLCDPDGTFLFLSTPRIPIRRRLTGNGREPFSPKPRDKVHLLFVVSRPDDQGFVDPRADPMAVMDSIEAEAPGRISVEFLRPPTLTRLQERLNDDRLPPIDILHFDGHGAYDPGGRLNEVARNALAASGASELAKSAATQTHHGFLLFEDAEHKSVPVPAPLVADLLWTRRVGLVILSACQSAMVSGEDPLGSVAPLLIRAGVPSVLAMTQSVLVVTARALGGHFYRELAAGRPIGAALEAARSGLYFDPIRGKRQRGEGTVDLTLQDWFVPALYQAGADTPLLKRRKARSQPGAMPAHNLPEAKEAGFFGRRRELFDSERWFVGGTRRIVISGFGGQGKTALATEAGRWLLRAGLFERVCFITYVGFQGSDPVQLAVSTLATVLSKSLIDAKAATAALASQPTLLILDNLETLEGAARTELLTAAADWSKQGGSRVLITARPGDLQHPEFPAQGSNLCRYRALDGLRPEDALDWFQALLRLPPKPVVPIPTAQALTDLFAKAGFHPLSIEVLTGVLKQQRVGDVTSALQVQLGQQGDPLLASLNLSLQRLDPDIRAALPGLGVFIDGAWEPILTNVLELDAAQWGRLRDGLLHAGLVVTEVISGIELPFIRFHPTLAPAMRRQLEPSALEAARQRYRSAYYDLSMQLYNEDIQFPEAVRGIAYRELPNLFAAVFASLEAGEDTAADLANAVNKFLTNFGRTRDRNLLQARAEAASGTAGSDAWYMTQSNRGEHLFESGRFAAAEAVFGALLVQLGDTPSLRRGWTLLRLARCHRSQGRLDLAEGGLRQALQEVESLPADRPRRALEKALRSDLGTVLMSRGDLDGAQAAHELGKAIAAELGDDRGVAVENGQLGAIFNERREFARAAQAYQDAIAAFTRLNEPSTVATCYHQLGLVYDGAGAFAEAEAAYRQSARITESLGDRRGSAETWMNIATVIASRGGPLVDAEPWFRKALAVFDAERDQFRKSQTLSNLATLLLRDAARLEEAGKLAEQALAIKRTLDPGVAEIWKTYGTLATIAAQAGDADAARRYRAQERQSFAAAPIAREYLRRHRALIDAVLAAVRQAATLPALEQALSQYDHPGWSNLVTALRSLLDGGRDEDALCEPLDREDWLIVTTILRCLADPVMEAALPPKPD